MLELVQGFGHVRVLVVVGLVLVEKRDCVDDAVLLSGGVEGGVVRAAVGHDGVRFLDSREVLRGRLVVVRIYRITGDDRVHVLARDRGGHVRPDVGGGDHVAAACIIAFRRASGQHRTSKSSCRNRGQGRGVKTISHRGYPTIIGNCFQCGKPRPGNVSGTGLSLNAVRSCLGAT